MDIFYEQLVTIKNTGKNLAIQVLIWSFAAILIALFLYLSLIFGPISLLLAFGAGFLAWFLSGKFSIEYEYILTNGEMDIDKITAKRKRKRTLSFKCSDVERMGKYSSGKYIGGNFSKTFVFCNLDENALFAIMRHDKLGNIMIVISPDDRISEGLAKFLPRQVAKDAFSGN